MEADVCRTDEFSDKNVVGFNRINFFLKFDNDLVVIINELLNDFLENGSVLSVAFKEIGFFTCLAIKVAKEFIFVLGSEDAVFEVLTFEIA